MNAKSRNLLAWKVSRKIDVAFENILHNKKLSRVDNKCNKFGKGHFIFKALIILPLKTTPLFQLDTVLSINLIITLSNINETYHFGSAPLSKFHNHALPMKCPAMFILHTILGTI